MASFGPTDQTNAGMNQLQGNAGTTGTAGGQLLNLGGGNTQAGANFFQTLLGGNQANTATALQPDVNRVNQANQQTLQAVNTLQPRGGGRSSTLFSLPFQGNQQIQALFNGARTTAAQTLPQIGLGQTGAGTNLFNVSNTGAADLAHISQAQQAFADAQKWKIFQTAMGGLAGGLTGRAGGAAGGA